MKSVSELKLTRAEFYHSISAGANVAPFCHAAAAISDDTAFFLWHTCLEVRKVTALVFRLSSTW